MKLEGLEGFAKHDQHEVMKRQFAHPGKVSGRGAMAGEKAAIGEPGAYDPDDANCRNVGVHPRAEIEWR